MESKIPLPTDNIYKFYALFGLMLLITSIFGVIFVSASTNEKLYELVKEHELIPEEQKEKGKSTLAVVIKQRIDIQLKNKVFFLFSLGATSGVSIILMWYGFRQWHTKIQPKQDELFELQLSRLRKELEQSNS